ncbi:ferredoxin reductase [Nocardioides sp. HDW12B]|uniref:ferredoxin reductase n=1 Tax=Nocardioides sp. HDW12B TaxID=2714939 RepID=UPI00140A8B0E|nr:ferredoxin reductase [Nocardioides sp. HDW12B]QIK67796.1 ferredoxin reductase [Nocardioides sp. HDW12B]
MSLTQSLLRSPVVAALTAPHGVDRYLELANPMWVVHDVKAQVVAITRETRAGEPVATLTLKPSRGWKGHESGQYVQVGVEVDGARRTRCFSVSSPESGPGDLITLTVRANPEGQVSKHLVREARVGDVINLSQAEGDFTLPNPLPSQVLLISGGSGITPVMSHLRTLLRRGYGGRITFVHYAQSPDHQIYAEELAELPPHVKVHLLHPDSGTDAFYSTEELARILPEHAEVDTWACGPAGLIEKVQETYDENPRLRVEYFKTSSLQPLEGVEGRTRFADADLESENTGVTLLEQAEALGLTPEYGCRMGICFSCVSRKSEGTVRNVRTGEESSQPDEDVRICVSAPVGDCVVDL